MVFVNSKTERDQIPSELSNIHSEAGRGDPRIFVSNSDASQGLATVTNAQLKEDARKAARELRKELENVSLSASPSPESDEAEEEPLLASEQTWANHKGQEMKAAVVDLCEKKVTFLLPCGKKVPYALSALSEESQKRLEGIEID